MANNTNYELVNTVANAILDGIPDPQAAELVPVGGLAPTTSLPVIIDEDKLKFGSTTIVTLAATTWTEVVLQSLTRNPRPYPGQRYMIKASSVVYLAQAVSSLQQGGAVVTLPTNPATATSGSAAGNFQLLADTYFVIDAERPGENSLWFFGPVGGEVVRITDISRVPYDEA